MARLNDALHLFQTRPELLLRADQRLEVILSDSLDVLLRLELLSLPACNTIAALFAKLKGMLMSIVGRLPVGGFNSSRPRR